MASAVSSDKVDQKGFPAARPPLATATRCDGPASEISVRLARVGDRVMHGDRDRFRPRGVAVFVVNEGNKPVRSVADLGRVAVVLIGRRHVTIQRRAVDLVLKAGNRAGGSRLERDNAAEGGAVDRRGQGGRHRRRRRSRSGRGRRGRCRGWSRRGRRSGRGRRGGSTASSTATGGGEADREDQGDRNEDLAHGVPLLLGGAVDVPGSGEDHRVRVVRQHCELLGPFGHRCFGPRWGRGTIAYASGWEEKTRFTQGEFAFFSYPEAFQLHFCI